MSGADRATGEIVRGKEAKVEAQASARWGEIRVGELLGPNPGQGGDQRESHVSDSLTEDVSVMFARHRLNDCPAVAGTRPLAQLTPNDEETSR